MMRQAIAVFLVLVFAAGCATIDRGPMQKIVVDSEPSRAALRASGCGKRAARETFTPAKLWVSRHATECTLTFTKIGYQEAVVKLHRVPMEDVSLELSPEIGEGTAMFFFTAGLSLVAFLTSEAVDLATGANYALEPSTIMVEMEPSSEDWRTREFDATGTTPER